jgi:acid phosphatase (class A)
MRKLIALGLLAIAVPVAAQTPVVAPAAQKPAHKTLAYLDPALFEPALLLPAPADKDSRANALELDTLHRMIASASPERLKQAREDAENENPAIFNHESALTASMAKAHFHRMRPYSADPTISFCEGKADPAEPAYKSYPSGHATLGYSVGVALARLVPAKAAPIMARAKDYALSREYCGAHYASDTQASEVLGTLAATMLLDDPRLADKVAAARAELARIG